jgi:hypothetical protein
MLRRTDTVPVPSIRLGSAVNGRIATGPVGGILLYQVGIIITGLTLDEIIGIEVVALVRVTVTVCRIEDKLLAGRPGDIILARWFVFIRIRYQIGNGYTPGLGAYGRGHGIDG